MTIREFNQKHDRYSITMERTGVMILFDNDDADIVATADKDSIVMEALFCEPEVMDDFRAAASNEFDY